MTKLVSQNLYYYIDPETDFYSYRVYFTNSFSRTNDENSDIKFVDVKDMMIFLLKELGIKDYLASIFAEYSKEDLPKFLQHPSLNDNETYLSLIVFTNNELSNFYKLLDYKKSISTNYSEIKNKELFHLNYSLTPFIIEKSNKMSYDEVMEIIKTPPTQSQTVESFTHRKLNKGKISHYIQITIMFIIIIILIIPLCIKANHLKDEF